MRRFWTNQEIELLKYLRHNGHSQKAIGRALNRSENSVNSKCWELKIPFNKSPEPKTSIHIKLDKENREFLYKSAAARGMRLSAYVNMLVKRDREHAG